MNAPTHSFFEMRGFRTPWNRTISQYCEIPAIIFINIVRTPMPQALNTLRYILLSSIIDTHENLCIEVRYNISKIFFKWSTVFPLFLKKNACLLFGWQLSIPVPKPPSLASLSHSSFLLASIQYSRAPRSAFYGPSSSLYCSKRPLPPPPNSPLLSPHDIWLRQRARRPGATNSKHTHRHSIEQPVT